MGSEHQPLTPRQCEEIRERWFMAAPETISWPRAVVDIAALLATVEELRERSVPADRLVHRERLAVCAWLLDRIGQYDPSSGIVAALGDRVTEILRGDHAAALAHGDLGDLITCRALRELAILADAAATEELTDE